MDKKVKWSIIAVSTATTLGFGGLVWNSQNATNSTNIASEENTIQDNSSTLNENQSQQDRFAIEDRHQRGYEHSAQSPDSSDDGSISQSSPDQGSSWGQDQFQQAPSSGFAQGNGSSGASR